MITKDQIISIVLKACPSFKGVYDSSDNQDLLYVVMGDLADHLLSLYKENKTEEFNELSKVIEAMHIDGDGYVKELATIGFLESIQNVWSNNGVDPKKFTKYLRPESKKWWDELNDFWEGKISSVGEGLHNKTINPTRR